MGLAVTSSFTETLAAESSSLEALAADSSATQASAGGIGSAEASAAGSSSTQASAGDSDSSMSAACSEASTDMDDIALGLRDRAAAVDTWVLELPSLPVYHFNNVEELQNVSAGDKYLQPPMNFAAIDSIAIRGGTAYLLQITQNVEHDINVGLLSVLACLPPHVGSVKFVWALPDDVWGHKRFNAKAVPQIADLSRPAVSGTAGHEMRFKSAEASMSATAESAEQGTAAEQHRSDMNIEAIKELVDKNITLVEKCIVACETQYKIAVPLPDYSAQAEPQTSSQPGPQASLSTTGSMARSAAWGFRRVRSPPCTACLV